jgi:hypothetical protein
VFGLKRFLRRWRRPHPPIPDRTWSSALASYPHAQTLPAPDRERLRELARLFLASKRFTGAHGLEVSEAMRVRVALHACVPILNLGLDYYSGWAGIIIYPGNFRVRHEYLDDSGVMHETLQDLCGESLSQGPMVLSWEALRQEPDYPDQDLVIHECAHKLDILNGTADGFPPLHADMSPKAWTRAWGAAYDDFCRQIDAGTETRLDPYAATNPAEFFAVLSESFFAVSQVVQEDVPAVYAQLAAFYRQDPLTRLKTGIAP